MAKKQKTTKYVYFFGGGSAEGNAKMRGLLGGKGANLAEMTEIGVPVPPGFTISTEACRQYYERGRKWPPGLSDQIDRHLAKLEKLLGRRLGDSNSPLLVSVRSGAAVSMPGMMDTVLNLGMNDKAAAGIAERSGNPRFAYDSYRRFIDMFGDVVMGVEHAHFEDTISDLKRRVGVELDTQLSADQLQVLVDRYKGVYRQFVGRSFPDDPSEQLRLSINAVFNSWNSDRAALYRQRERITGLQGTAVNVQTMVFGNSGEDSATGVAFTRNPSTGRNEFYGEYLINAQGEDVVAGIRTPEPMDRLARRMPKAYRQLLAIRKKLERHYRDMQDIEFTIESGVLYMLQTRGGKRTGAAAVKIAVDMVKEKLVNQRTAVNMVEPDHLDQLLHPRFDEAALKKAASIASGLPASPGAAVGQVVFTAADAQQWHRDGRSVILTRTETSPEDVGGMDAAEGILTSTGGMTSHAAVVARGWGKCCVAGAGEVRIDYSAKRFDVNGRVVKEGDWISLDGTSGEVYLGRLPTVSAKLSGDFKKFMTWVDRFRKLKIRTNADTPQDSRVARQFGAEGIGLCRTEHMFFEGNRINHIRQVILASGEYKRIKEEIETAESQLDENPASRELKSRVGDLKARFRAPAGRFRGALRKLLPIQRRDFEGIFRAMSGLPVTIRLLDPPLHEFLPTAESEQRHVAAAMGVSSEEVASLVSSLHEANPMLGHRGCRLGLSYPEIYEMQVQAIIEAACKVSAKGVRVLPEIMIPLVGSAAELEILADSTRTVADAIIRKKKSRVKFLVGTMIEVPRAALAAKQIAGTAEFFSFGTNDLTQMTFGFSRDDAGKFLGEYVQRNILTVDPFQELDQEGVGRLIEMAIEGGRSVRRGLKLGICGEHGGDPSSVAFCHRRGIDYVSCSPFRVPIARLAAAQAALAD
jgi:pyruvate,orthophosphate dikinase